MPHSPTSRTSPDLSSRSTLPAASPSADLMKLCRGADILALGFGTTVVMWEIGYFCRLSPGLVPAGMLVFLLLACQLAGGFLAGRHTGRGWAGGVYVGILSSLLNILILGSLLSGHEPNRVTPTALLWLPGALLVGAAIGGIGAALGAARRGGQRASSSSSRATSTGDVPWFGWFTKTAALATFFLVLIGGAVTSKRAGLAVVDWPNSFGYNMFLYPLSKMSGGVYYEHAHRLFGSLVGLITLVLVVYLFLYDRRSWIKSFGLVALAMVVIQGILGGLRVTGRFTLSTSQADVAPNLYLAVVHGVLGQVFFAAMVAMAVFTSSRWLRCEPAPVRASIASDRGLSATLVVILIVQLVLGAIQRHMMRGLMIHITMAVVVSALAVACGIRAWGLYQDRPVLPRLGKWLLAIVGLQILLGIGAVIALGVYSDPAHMSDPPAIQVVVRTAHQAMGALLLCCSVLLALWTRRVALPETTATTPAA